MAVHRPLEWPEDEIEFNFLIFYEALPASIISAFVMICMVKVDFFLERLDPWGASG